MKTLHLNLKRKWFDLILSGEKTEEYREIKDHWFKIFKNNNCRAFFKFSLSITYENYMNIQDNVCLKVFKETFELMKLEYDTIIFSNGYSKNRDQFVIELKGIEIKEGNPDWGAELGKKYFVIKLGKIISHENN